MRKGEVSSAQLVLIIIALAGFVVLVLFLFSLRLQESGGEQACRLSALTRASLPVAARTSAPLSCTTQKVCLTADSGKCGLSMAGESPDVVKVSLKDPSEAARKIEQVTADAMYRCWQTLGQGKLDLFSTYEKSRSLNWITGNEIEPPNCIICGRIAVDPSITEAVKDVVNFKTYLASTPVPGKSITYLQAFSDASVTAFPQVGPRTLSTSVSNAPSFSTSGDEYAIVFMQIRGTPPSDATAELFSDFALAGALGSGSAFYLYPGSVITKASSLVTFVQKNGKLFLKAAPYVVAVGAGVGVATSITAKASQELAAGYCGEYNPDKNLQTSQGCSIMQVVPYDAGTINQFCGQIDGTP